MYYIEKWINGKLYWKGSPDGEWIEFTIAQYKQKIKDLEKQVKKHYDLSVVDARLLFDKGIKYAHELANDSHVDENGELTVSLDVITDVAKTYVKHVKHFLNEGAMEISSDEVSNYTIHGVSGSASIDDDEYYKRNNINSVSGVGIKKP